MSDAKPKLNNVQQFEPGVPAEQFETLLQEFPVSHFERLKEERFKFYRTTFWFPLERQPENIFETIVMSLKESAQPSSAVVGVEWWFSVMHTNATPQWLLECHFDRENLSQRDVKKIRHPEKASVLFLNTVPYGELVLTDQVLTKDGARPRQPKQMVFVPPRRNHYAVFPGDLYHGVIGRMWRPVEDSGLRISMAVNWWTHPPQASYLHDSRECLAAFQLDE